MPLPATLTSAFLAERNTPYRIPLSIADTDTTCLGKHLRLKAAFEQYGYCTRVRIFWFRWNDLPIPSTILAFPHDEECTHLALEVLVQNEWTLVDATWDPSISPPFTINDPSVYPMRVAVPYYEVLSPEASITYMDNLTTTNAEDELARQHAFLEALNTWLQQLRTSKSP